MLKIASQIVLLLISFYLLSCNSLNPKSGLINSRTKIHYKSYNSGPLVIFIHGHNDFDLTWRELIHKLPSNFKKVTLSLRGYYPSEIPKDTRFYKMDYLVEDVLSAIRHFGEKKAVLVGHDLGAAIAWQVALRHPDRVDKLISLNFPHPRGFVRDLREYRPQIEASKYAFDYAKGLINKDIDYRALVSWVSKDKYENYIRYMKLSDYKNLNLYYSYNFPNELFKSEQIKIRHEIPSLIIFGLNDRAILPHTLIDNKGWGKDIKVVRVKGAGHDVHHDQVDRVAIEISNWLNK